MANKDIIITGMIGVLAGTAGKGGGLELETWTY
jgi:hypothetical protein